MANPNVAKITLNYPLRKKRMEDFTFNKKYEYTVLQDSDQELTYDKYKRFAPKTKQSRT